MRAAVTVVVLGSVATAHAQSDAAVREASTRFQEGLTLHDRGQEEEARLKFEQAYAVVKTPNILFNLARSEQLTGHYVEALAHYRIYAADSDARISGRDRETARRHMTELASSLGHVRVEAAAGTKVSVDGVGVPGEAPFAEPLDVSVGKHTLTGRLGEQATPSVEVSLSAGESTRVKLGPEGRGGAAGVTPGLGAGIAGGAVGTGVVGGTQAGTGTGLGNAPSPTPWRGDREEHRFFTPKHTTAIALGVGALSAGAIGLGYAMGASHQATLVSQLAAMGTMNSCSGSTSARCQQLADADSAHKRDVALEAGFFVGAGVLFLTGLAVLKFWPESPAPMQQAVIVPSVTPGGGAMNVIGRF